MRTDVLVRYRFSTVVFNQSAILRARFPYARAIVPRTCGVHADVFSKLSCAMTKNIAPPFARRREERRARDQQIISRATSSSSSSSVASDTRSKEKPGYPIGSKPSTAASRASGVFSTPTLDTSFVCFQRRLAVRMRMEHHHRV